MTKKLQPKLRFRGFTDAWEQREFSSIFGFLKTNSYSRASLEPRSTGIVDIHYGDILVNYDCCLLIDGHTLPTLKDPSLADAYRNDQLMDGDIVIADTAEDQTAGRCVELFDVGSRRVLAGLHTIAIRSTIKFGAGYLGYYLSSPAYRKQLIPQMQGTKVISISKTSLKNTSIASPQPVEQIAIGALLRKLDALIAAEKRKLNLLEKKKSALLQQIFDQKIRFKDYVGPWKQREFGAVYKRRSEKNNPIRFKKDRIITVSSMRFLYSTFKISEEYLSTYNIMREGDIAFEGNRNSRYAFGRFVENTIGDGIVSHVFNVYQPIDQSHDLLFWKYYINNDYIMRNILKKSTISATMMRTLIDADLKKQILVIPSSEEQKKIGKLFGVVDSLLAAEGRKIDLLILKKKSLLQQMFV